MAVIATKMDGAQLAFLANEITKTYMADKNALSQEQFILEYFRMYQNALKTLEKEQNKNLSSEQSLQDIMNSISNDQLNTVTDSRGFR